MKVTLTVSAEGQALEEREIDLGSDVLLWIDYAYAYVTPDGNEHRAMLNRSDFRAPDAVTKSGAVSS